MIGDYFNKDGIEISMNTVCSVHETMTDNFPGLHIYTGGLTDKMEPYSLVIYGGPVDINTGIPRNPTIDFRISLISPKYIQYDRLFTKYERDLFNKIMHEEWDHVLYLCHMYHTDWYEFGDILDPKATCPDYFLLETSD